ncbi:hypothetical protein NQ315_010394 [Exocentrus adspersus]|uniref:PH domain-containing protein n=1 Tax=Exocentrus adspersus TaxID=1586481 RepID=A0AAV8WCB5_9CUCU|nr:hypothetical protein NQ315_010394 [Exocentrus adspersus]
MRKKLSLHNINKNVETITQDDQLLSPYIDLPSTDACQDIKCGYIFMKLRVWFRLERMKRVYGAIHNNWLIIYLTNKDMKPFHTFHLKDYEAKEAKGHKATNFELTSTLPDGKVFYFMALTHKDMLQWVVYINRCHDNSVVQSKGLDIEENKNSSPDDDTEEHYDCVLSASNKEAEDDEEIYSELDDIAMLQVNNTTSKQKIEAIPPLPGRPSQKSLLLHVLPPLVKSPSTLHEPEEAFYDDISEAEQNSDNSSSQEDSTYEAFVVNPRIIKKSVPISENKDTEPKKDTKTKVKSKSDTRDPSFIQEIHKKHSELTEPQQEAEESGNKGTVFSPLKTFKGTSSLSPPVVPKVPPLPAKPKLKDRAHIGKRHAFASYRQGSTSLTTPMDKPPLINFGICIYNATVYFPPLDGGACIVVAVGIDDFRAHGAERDIARAYDFEQSFDINNCVVHEPWGVA